jgi:acetolactate synthase-1/2/3 large subunit
MGFRSFGLDYANPDFARFAESHGAVGMTVRKGDDLSEVLRKAFSLKKVVVIECPIDYSVNYETFSKEIEDLVCEM